MTARSEAKAEEAINEIKATAPKSTGVMKYLHLDLEDLSSIKASAEQFQAAESELHVLFNNAGVMGPENEVQRTKQGYEMHLGVNCLGPFLFTKLLTPTLAATAQSQSTPPNTVRVIFMSSFAAELFAEKNVGLNMDNLDYHINKPAKYRYGVSKAGDWAYAVELSKRSKNEGIIGLAVNPGNIRSELFRHQSSLFKLLTSPANYPIASGACSELWAGLSPEITVEKGGSYVIPFGKIYPVRQDLEAATKPEDQGGNGTTSKFWKWSEEQISKYL